MKIFKNKDDYRKYFDIKNTSNEFKEIYDKIKKENFNDLESLRKKIIIQYIFEYFFICVSIISFIMLCTRVGEMINEKASEFVAFFTKILFTSVAIAVVFRVLRNNNKTKYKESYKEDVVSFFIRLLDPDFKYNFKKKEHSKIDGPYPVTTTTEIEYRKAEFDKIQFDYIIADDWIQKELNQKEYFQITDIKVVREYKDSKGMTIKLINIFEGLFFWIESNKDTNTWLKININQNKIMDDLAEFKIAMDSGEFEKIFDIYSDDKILAMRILTPDIMEIIMDFYKKYHIPFEICYRNNMIYIRFFIKNMFEPEILRESMDIKPLYMYYSILEFIMEFSKGINKLAADVEI